MWEVWYGEVTHEEAGCAWEVWKVGCGALYIYHHSEGVCGNGASKTCALHHQVEVMLKDPHCFSQGAIANTLSGSGVPVLILAVSSGCLRCIETLVKGGALPSAQTKW